LDILEERLVVRRGEDVPAAGERLQEAADAEGEGARVGRLEGEQLLRGVAPALLAPAAGRRRRR